MWIGFRTRDFTSPEAAKPAQWVQASGQPLDRVGIYASLFEATVHDLEVTTTDTSTTVTAADTSNLIAGMYIEGTGIPQGATIVSKTASDFVISSAATASGTITMKYSQYGLGDGSNFEIGSDNYFVLYHIDSTTGNGVSLPNLPEDTDLSDTAKLLAVEGATAVFSTKSTLLSGVIKETSSAPLTDGATVVFDVNSQQEQKRTLVSSNTATTIEINRLPEDAICKIELTISSVFEYTYTFTALDTDGITPLTVKVLATGSNIWVQDNANANDEYQVFASRTGNVVKITPSNYY